MTKAELHYLGCVDDDRERFACVARRDFQNEIDRLNDRISELEMEKSDMRAELTDQRGEG